MMKQDKNDLYPFMLHSKASNLGQEAHMKKTPGCVI